MALTNTQLTKAGKIYEIYWDSYIKGDLVTFSSTLDDSFDTIGTSETEVAHNKTDGIEIYKAQMGEIVGKVEMRNRQISTKPLGDLVLINETCDIYVWGEPEWKFYSKIRISTLLHETESGWKVIQQHGSLPDMRVQEGETLAIEKINRENLELRDAIKRRTVELENKSRELEIEASLERVRAVAMGMAKPDDMLNVCQVLYKELQSLGFIELRNAMIHSFEEENEFFTNYDYSAANGGTINRIPVKGHASMESFVNEMRKSNEAFQHLAIEGKELQDWITFRKANKEPDDPKLDNIKSLHYYNYSIGESGIGISTYSNITNEKQEILARFRNVFQLAYQRYADISKAETQAREAEIELALERVRAQTMAMHSSEDVGKCIVRMFGELTALGVDEGTRFGIGILNHDNENNQLWTAKKVGEEVKMHIGNLDMTSHPLLISAHKAWKAQVPFHKYVLEGKDLLDYYQMLNKAPDYKIQIPLDQLPEREIQHCFIFEHGLFYAFSPREFQPELIHIIHRFSSLFGQTYRRYLDLVKAEAQTREARIEAALEKVRSRSLAMHKSDELKEVIQVVYDQLVQLNIHVDHAGFIIDYKNREDMHIWLADQQQGVPSEITIPYFDSPHWNSFRETKANGGNFFANLLHFEVKNKFYQDLFEWIPELTKDAQQAIFKKPALAISTVLLDNVGLYIEHYRESPFTVEENAILMRFGKVFQQSYTRFLDLQKAEAQARDAKIEAALERTRTHSMLMQHSDEIKNISEIFHQQLLELDIPTEFSYVWLPDESKNNHQFWASWAEMEKGELVFTSKQVTYPLDKTEPYTAACYAAWANPETVHVEFIPPAAIPDFFSVWAELLEGAKNLKAAHFKEGIYYSEAYMRYGCFGINIRRKLSAEEKQVLKRFSIEFERAYTRFLDLQKAEAQAKESQIESALERVRSTSLAMHSSRDLSKVVFVVFTELVKLDARLDRCLLLIVDPKKLDITWYLTGKEGLLSNNGFLVPDNTHPSHQAYLEGWREKRKKWQYLLGGDEKKRWDAFGFSQTGLAQLPDFIKSDMLAVETIRLTISSENFGCLIASSLSPLSEAHAAIVDRFTSVFNQAYSRFLDLQRAEAQAREAQIEASLERVRAHAMGLRKSGDLEKIISVIFEELQKLGLTLYECSIFLRKGHTREFNVWGKSNSDDHGFLTNYQFYFVDHPILNHVIRDLDLKIPYREFSLDQDEIKSYADLIFAQTDFKDSSQAYKDSFYSLKRVYAGQALFQHGLLEAIGTEPLPGDLPEVLRRFSQVIDLTYTRFLDLQKAEGQAREAQIEASLEKVRSRSLAMHTTHELGEVVKVLVEKLTDLGVVLDSNGVIICTYFQDSKNVMHWIASPDFSFTGSYLLPYFDHPIFSDAWNSKLSGVDYFSKEYSKDEKNSFWEYAFKHSDYKNFPDDFKHWVLQNNKHVLSFAWQKNSAILIPSHTGITPSESEQQILIRFAKVFEQAYTRFLDLQKAEAQSREAQIEAALERVRAQAMAMHQTQDLGKTIMVYYEQLDDLIDSTIVRCGAGLLNKENTYAEMSTASKSIDGMTYQVKGTINMKGHVLLENTYEHWLKQEEYSHVLHGNEIKAYYQYISNQVAIPENKGNDALFFYFPMFTEGSFYVVTSKALPEDELQIFRRFSTVLSLTYRRFNDLQKAEAQAREAQIEAALERVRARTMAMQRSDELLDVASVLFQQVKGLGVPQWNCGFNIWELGDEAFTYYPGTPDGVINPSPCKIPLYEHPVFRRFDDSRKKKIDLLVYEKAGEEQKGHYQYMLTLPGVGDLLKSMLDAGFEFPVFQIDHIANFAYGNLIFITYEHFPEMHDVFKRFAKVFEQTYTRFLDLQKVEAQAIETTKRASVDRVRAEIASMRTTKDLERITPLIWNELTTLGVPFIRSGVFIMDEADQQVQVHLSTPAGKAIAAFHLNYKASVQSRQIVSHWREMKVFKDHMDEAAFAEYTKNLVQQGALAGDEKYVTENHPTDLYLHFLPFAQGMLYVGNDTPLKEEELQLVQDLAEAFSTAYARYEDFNNLEAAKLQVDKALVNLKQAQQQLVQSEKMASLGELTAGIAHEIQNPLNFVNNFSEVSSELVDEMNEELGKGNIDDAKEIATDLKQNLEKITHHGKRAGEIVKGMLQHSRTSSGQKELTDINALADEYLRLAYHGLRAKDKTFNARMENDFDHELPKIEVVPQDIGRVILNLITNAFYAVNEKSKEGISGYEPTVSVSTKKKENFIDISVEDNGSGIPEQIKEKIFQPFFTTKPTGQGTGLGLSLSYDIVKAHGGNLEVESPLEGVKGARSSGTIFTIKLPH